MIPGRSHALAALVLCLFAAAIAPRCAARAEPVRELARTAQDLTLGNSRFRLTVRSSGALSVVQVGETNVVSFISLYTNPVSPQTGKAVRCCQYESPGLGDRPSDMQAVLTDGAATVTITRDCSHAEVDGNAPLWRLQETVAVTDAGGVTVRYRCRWLRLSRWDGFSLVTAFTMDTFRDRTFEAYVPGLTVPGLPPKGLPERDLLQGLMGLQLTSSAGPVRQWLGGTNHTEIQDWGQYLSIMASPAELPYGGMTMYRDTKAAFSVSLQLPLP